MHSTNQTPQCQARTVSKRAYSVYRTIESAPQRELTHRLIAQELCKSISTVQRAIAELQSNGLLRRVRRRYGCSYAVVRPPSRLAPQSKPLRSGMQDRSKQDRSKPPMPDLESRILTDLTDLKSRVLDVRVRGRAELISVPVITVLRKYIDQAIKDYLDKAAHTQHNSSAQSGSGPRKDRMGKIVSSISRVAPTNEDHGIARAGPRRPRSRREEQIAVLCTAFCQKLWSGYDYSPAARQCWNELLDKYGDVDTVLRVAREARAQRNRLLSDEYPVFCAQTVLYYARYKRKVKSADAQQLDKVGPIARKHLKEAINNDGSIDKAKAARVCAMYNLCRSDLRGILGEQQLDILFATTDV